MEKPIFPMSVMRITQGYMEGTHEDSYAIDNAGEDGSESDVFAPFTGIIKKIYPNDANEVWLESSNPVEYPDGTIDYMTIMFAHADNIDHLFVGKKINQKEVFYKEGTKGNVTGAHCHIECAKGKLEGNGWHQNKSGFWSINNGKKPQECLWIEGKTILIDNYDYSFKKISTEPVENKDFIFIAPKKDLYGVYLKEKQKLIIKSTE